MGLALSGVSDPGAGLELQEFYDHHPPSPDLIIYQNVEDGSFFAARDGAVIEVLARNEKTGSYERREPLEHMLTERNRIIDWKSSEMHH